MSLLTLFIAAVSARAGSRQRRRAFSELIALDDRLLADIGLRRTDIPAIFQKHLDRQGTDTPSAFMALSALQAKLVFRHRRLPPIWPQL
jgi:uncharacterized protein YjiS (DUF1127 family)